MLYHLNLRLYFPRPPTDLKMVDRSATAELATLKSVAAFWELLTRHGRYLPEYSSKYITEKQLLLVQQNKIFALNQSQVVFKLCVKPPSKLILI